MDSANSLRNLISIIVTIIALGVAIGVGLTILTSPASAYPTEQEVQDLVEEYYSSHTYIENVYDCSEMSQDFWNMCYTKGWTTEMGVREVKTLKDGTKVYHCWVVVEVDDDTWLAADPTCGFTIKSDEVVILSGVRKSGAFYYTAQWFQDPRELRNWMLTNQIF